MAKRPLGASHWKQLAAAAPARIGDEARARLACPDDDAPLDFLTVRDEYVCPACARLFRELDGYLAAMPRTDPYALNGDERDSLEAAAAGTEPPDPTELFGPLWPLALREAGSLQGKWLLDVCCGTGWAAVQFAEAGAHVFAVDIVAGEGGLASAARLRDGRNLNFDLVQADVCRLPFLEASFDVVFAARTIHTLRRPERLLKEVGRVLKSDGLFLSLGEPIGAAASGGFGDTDPRRGGRPLSLSQYAGVFHEGGLSLTPLFADDAPGRGSILQRVRKHLRHHSSEEQRLFLGRHEGSLQQAEGRFRLPWQRKEGTGE